MNRSHASRQTRTVAGYFLPQVEPSKMSSSGRGGASVGGGVDRPQRGGDGLAVVVGDEPHRGPDQVHHTGLDHGVRPGRLDRLREPGQPVAAGDQHVWTPRLRSSASTPAQNFAPSLVCTQIPSTCLIPSQSTPTAMWAALLRTWWLSRTFTTNASR